MRSLRSVRRLSALVAVGFSAAVWYGCADQAADSLTGPSFDRSAAQGAQGFERAIAAQERHTERLLKLPSVVGTAVGLNPAGKPVVQIFVTAPNPQGVPDALDGIPVQRKVTGLFMAGSNPTTRQRPAPVGFSVGHPDVTAGTIGARVKDGTGNVYILSNNHVLANSNDAQLGDPIYQPGVFDGGTASDQIATLSAFNPLDFSQGGWNSMDAAIAQSTVDDLSNSTPTDDGYGTPSSEIYGDANGDGWFDDVPALLGLDVQKYGRTTELTAGQITGVNAAIEICYEVMWIFCVKSAVFVDQLVVEPGTFSDGGDSGSLIVALGGGNHAVGLLFAGSATQTIANRIDRVLLHFNVSIDGDDAQPPDPVTDVAVTDVSAPASVTQGDVATVDVTVQNVGNQDVGTFNVTLVDDTDGITIGSQPVSGLAAGAGTTLTFDWNTAGASFGDHTLTASHNLVDDEDPLNNEASTTSTVVEQTPPVTDVAVAGVSAPASVTQGDLETVDVTVQNVGNQDVGTFNVTLDDDTDAVTIGTQTVNDFAAGASIVLTFNWNTTGASIGDHTLTASHNLTDDNDANDQASTTSTVNEQPPQPSGIHVGDLDGWKQNNKKTWSAIVEITIHDASHNPLNGATINGTWDPAGLASDECTTGGGGTCIMLYPGLKKKQSSVSFTVTSVTMDGQTYEPADNHDPDGDSDGTTIVVRR
jgi:hypothetical protein